MLKLIITYLRYKNLMTMCDLILTSKLQNMKYIRLKNCYFMLEELRNAYVNGSKLRNKFLKLDTRYLKSVLIAKK